MVGTDVELLRACDSSCSLQRSVALSDRIADAVATTSSDKCGPASTARTRPADACRRDFLFCRPAAMACSHSIHVKRAQRLRDQQKQKQHPCSQESAMVLLPRHRLNPSLIAPTLRTCRLQCDLFVSCYKKHALCLENDCHYEACIRKLRIISMTAVVSSLPLDCLRAQACFIDVFDVCRVHAHHICSKSCRLCLQVSLCADRK